MLNLRFLSRYEFVLNSNIKKYLQDKCFFFEIFLIFSILNLRID